MAGKTYWQQDKALSVLTGSTVTGAPATFVNLLTALPDDDDNVSGGDPTGTEEWDVDRVSVTLSSISSEGDKRYVSNVGALQWVNTDLSASSKTLLGIGIWDASSGDNLLYWKAFDTAKVVEQGGVVLISATEMKVRED